MPSDSGNRSPVRWSRAFLEALVIVSSILLALGAEAWWQQQSDRAAEQEVLAALQDEVSENEVSLRVQADSISESIQLLQSLIEMSPAELASAMNGEQASHIGQTLQRPWTVEIRVGVLESTLGTDRVSLIRSQRLISELVQYQSVRKELDEIGGFLGRVSVDAFVALNGLPDSHNQLSALMRSKLGYWTAYRRYLDRFMIQTGELRTLIEEETE